MWEENTRKQHSAASRSKLVNNNYDQTDDLHAWSIYRQNLNADLSECAIGVNKSANTERPFGNFQLRETTVNNILSHPKYGPRLRNDFLLKNQDPYNYLRFGLPRVKANNNTNQLNSQINLSNRNLVLNHSNHQRLNYETNEIKNLRKTNSRRHSLSSNDVEISSLNADTAVDQVDRSNQRTSQNELNTKLVNGKINNNSRLTSNHLSNNDRLDKRTTKQHSNHHLNYSQSSPKGRPPIDSQHHESQSVINHSNHRNINEHSFTNQQQSNHHYLGNSTFLDNAPTVNQPKFPHLIVRNLYFELDKTSNSRRVCGAQRQKVRIIDNVSFEVRAGELLALMATNELEGTSILDVLSNRHNKSRSRMKGDLIYNGVFLTPAKLSETLAYVGQDLDLCPKMSTRQTILFATLLRSPAKKRTFDTKKRIDAVLEELGLSEVRHTSVADLTGPEKRRLLIAMSLMLDTDLLLLDQPTKEMDIFDTFFLIEYLRQWSYISGRCVILTIQPSTFEIFTMLTKVALISTGRVLYFGPRREMINYFSSIDYPCPAYKNPADYYLDLVTLDNLSTEAVLESSERIETLVELYRHASQQTSNFVPPAPSLVVDAIKKQNFAIVFLSLWIIDLSLMCLVPQKFDYNVTTYDLKRRSLIFTFPYNVIYMFRNIVIAFILSLLTGFIFYHIRIGREQEFIWDRIMFYHCLLAIMPVPLYLIQMNDVYKEKQYVLNEIKMGYYSKSSYFTSNFIYTLPSSTLMLIAYALPASSLASQKHNLIFYIAIMLAYLHTIRILALGMAWAFRKRSNAVTCFAIIYTFIIFTAGTSIHHKDLTIGIRLFQYFSPFKYAHLALINWEFNSLKDSATRYLCSMNPVIEQESAILIKADCGFELKDHILIWFNYLGKIPNTSTYFIAFGLISLVFLIFNAIAFCLFSRRKNSIKKDGNRQLLRSSYK